MHIVLLITIILSHMFLLSKLIFFPYPELFIYPYLTKIGLVPYKEILDQHFPGVMFFPINLATLGVDTPEEMRILQFFLVVISHVLMFAVSKKVFKTSHYLLIPNILYLIWQPFLEGYVLWIDSFIAPILLAACFLSLGFQRTQKKQTLLYLGLIFGLAVLFKQVTIPLVIGYSIYLWFKYRQIKYVEYLALGLSIPITYLLYFVLSNSIWTDFYYWTLTFNLTVFAEMGRKFATVGEVVKIIPLFGLSLIGLMYLYFRKKNIFFKDVVGIPVIYFIGSLAFAYARFDYVHLQPALVFGVLILSRLLGELKQNRVPTVIIILLISVLITLRGYWGFLGNKVLFYGETEKKVAETVLERVAKGDHIFAYGTLPHIYQMTNTVPAGNVFVFQFPWFMKIAEDRVYDGLIVNTPKVIIRDKSAIVAGINLVDYMDKIGSFVDKYYHTVDMVGDVEIMISN